MSDPALFGRSFAGDTWNAWRAFLAAIFGHRMEEDQLATFRACTARQRPPGGPAREAWVVVGRRGGKSRIAALVAVFLAAFRDYSGVLAPGERGTIVVIASDRRQARVVFRYVAALLDVPMLARLVAGRTAETINLTTGVSIEVHTASFRAVRGYTIIAAVLDEIAFWRSEDSSNPGTEIVAGLRPGMATVPGSLLLAISSPYARRGVLWEAHRQHFGRDDDPVVVWQSPTRTMHPLIDERVIADAYAADEAAARAEWGAQFRSDLEDYVSREVIETLVAPGRHEVPRGFNRYFAFCDPAGGSGADSMAVAISHIGGSKVVLDLVRETRPPFSPEEVVAEFCAILKSYGIRRVTGDRYAGEWPAERFKKHGIVYTPAEMTKSQIYAEVLPILNSRAIELLDDRRLVAQFLGLERRTAWGGRDSIDHPPGQHDDVVNAAAGALLLAWAARRAGSHLPIQMLGEVRVTTLTPAPPERPTRVFRW